MYGIVNKAIKELLIEQHGVAVWDKVRTQAGVEHDTFLSNEPYDDAVTYQLAGAAAEVLGTTVPTILHAFGEYWILKTGMKSYGSLMEAGGQNLREFLLNLPSFHSRVMLMFPNLKPPEFLTHERGEQRIEVHYYSVREGLSTFTAGLLSGLGKMYGETVQVELEQSRDTGHDHEVFLVTW